MPNSQVMALGRSPNQRLQRTGSARCSVGSPKAPPPLSRQPMAQRLANAASSMYGLYQGGLRGRLRWMSRSR
jgi:hypothetical protein